MIVRPNTLGRISLLDPIFFFYFFYQFNVLFFKIKYLDVHLLIDFQYLFLNIINDYLFISAYDS